MKQAPSILKSTRQKGQRKKTSAEPLPKEELNFLLLEGIHPAAEEALRAAGFRSIESLPGSLARDPLIEMLKGVHVLGIRSKTQITERVPEAVPDLLAVGCFCIGTDQVDMDAATRRGVAVFNAPFSHQHPHPSAVLNDAPLPASGRNPAIQPGEGGR